MVIRERYLSKIRPFIGKDIIKVLTGIRRGGKSVLLEQIRDNYPKLVLYQEGSFRGNYEGIPAVRIEDWLQQS